MQQEQEWVARAQAGDRDAFGALVERYWLRLQRWLSGLTCNPQAAEDLAQGAFLKAWVGLRALRDASQFVPWLFRIAKNGFIDWQRRAISTSTLPLNVPGSEAEPTSRLEEQENQRLFEQACARLPVLFRGAFLLWAQEGFTQAQLAEALEITEETARWRVFKARQLLVRALRGCLDETKP